MDGASGRPSPPPLPSLRTWSSTTASRKAANELSARGAMAEAKSPWSTSRAGTLVPLSLIDEVSPRDE